MMILMVDHLSRFPERCLIVFGPLFETDLVKPLCSIKAHCNAERLWGANVGAPVDLSSKDRR